MRRSFVTLLLAALAASRLSACAPAVAAADKPFALAEDDGYRGIWYANQKTGDEYVYKYSGGMPTYPQQHVPIAIYAPKANKTFFVYGGSPPGEQRLLHMVSYYDHATGTVPRPRILLDKKTSDAHDNPTLAIDAAGHLWIFSNAHGTSRPSFIHRSVEPYAIDRFQHVLTTNFSYGQPWSMADGGFLLMHTRYVSGNRVMHWMSSEDGAKWSEPVPLARIAKGHYQVSWSDGRRVATAFNYHPQQGGLNARTNLYFLHSRDGGQTWQNAAGDEVPTPLEEPQNAALVRDYESEGKLVYLKQLQFDAGGRPVVLYLTSGGHEPGPKNDPRTWHVATWRYGKWEFRDVTISDHNYDFGSLYLEEGGTWRLIAPTAAGAQPYCTGGDMEMWTSDDEGRTWERTKRLTHDAARNHSFARQPLHARPEFYALWGDGNTHEPSESSLYFTDREGTHVWRLPAKMTQATEKPQVAW